MTMYVALATRNERAAQLRVGADVVQTFRSICGHHHPVPHVVAA